jgi:hypothetical protein
LQRNYHKFKDNSKIILNIVKLSPPFRAGVLPYGSASRPGKKWLTGGSCIDELP